MVSKKIISEIIGKCGKNQIKSKLSKYSKDEKIQLMNGRLNDGEWKEYNLYRNHELPQSSHHSSKPK